MNDETITLDKMSVAEILFIDKSGSYRALYTQGDLTQVFTESSGDVPLELDFTLAQTMHNLNALGYDEKNKNNTFTLMLPSVEDLIIRFKFIKGDSDEQ
jgi:hypothetical protein